MATGQIKLRTSSGWFQVELWCHRELWSPPVDINTYNLRFSNHRHTFRHLINLGSRSIWIRQLTQTCTETIAGQQFTCRLLYHSQRTSRTINLRSMFCRARSDLSPAAPYRHLLITTRAAGRCSIRLTPRIHCQHTCNPCSNRPVWLDSPLTPKSRCLHLPTAISVRPRRSTNTFIKYSANNSSERSLCTLQV